MGREEILNLNINERILREHTDSQWDTEWQAYWIPADSSLDTWLRLQGCEYRLVQRDIPDIDHENFK